MNAASFKPKDIARVSHYFSNITQKYCKMDFFYYMYGSGLGILRMLVEPDNEQRKEVLWYRVKYRKNNSNSERSYC